MKDLINRSYQAIKGRGLIDEFTTNEDFFDKIKEEMIEFVWEYNYGLKKEDEILELIDLITACIMYLHHNDIDFIEYFEKIVIKNEKRANERKERISKRPQVT